MQPQGLLWDSLFLQHPFHATPLSLTPCQVLSLAGGWEGALNVFGCGSALICVLSEAARLLTGFLPSRLSWAQWCLGPAWGEVIRLDLPAGCALCTTMAVLVCLSPACFLGAVRSLSRWPLLLLSLWLHFKTLFMTCCFLNLFRSLFVRLFLLGINFFSSPANVVTNLVPPLY